MKPSALARKQIQAARHWVFRWRGLDGTPLRGMLALLITGGAFSLFAATVRIRVSAPQQWVERKASIIHLANAGEGEMWALRAREGGPFPSRLDPVDWQKPGNAIIGATRLAGTPYLPQLTPLPSDEEIPTPPLATKGERVFPKRTRKPIPEVTPVETKLVPALYPLSDLRMDEVPQTLPSFEAFDPAMPSVPWRFVLRLRADGSVSECLAMVDEPGGEALAKWLESINFTPAVAKKSEWIGIGVGFVNQPVHGPDAR